VIDAPGDLAEDLQALVGELQARLAEDAPQPLQPPRDLVRLDPQKDSYLAGDYEIGFILKDSEG